MKDSKIRWTMDTWNPIRGCTRVSEGCRNCYAENVAARFSGPGLPYEGLAEFVGEEGAREARWTGEVRFVEHVLDWPIRAKRSRLIFVNSMSDLFHEKLTFEQIDRIFAVMAVAKHHTFQVLTKRPDRMLEYFSSGDHRRTQVWNAKVHAYGKPVSSMEWPLPNVWIGTTAEDQAAADQRVPLLSRVPAAVRWVSIEPMIGRVTLRKIGHRDYLVGPGRIDWVVIGGESGDGARPMAPSWARLLRDECADAGVAFFMKQWGEWSPIVPTADTYIQKAREVGDESVYRIGKKAAGWLLDGKDFSEYPRAWTQEAVKR